MVIKGDFERRRQEQLDAFERRFGPRFPVKNERRRLSWWEMLCLIGCALILLSVGYRLGCALRAKATFVNRMPLVIQVERSKTYQEI